MTMTPKQIDAICGCMERLIERATLAWKAEKYAVAEECLRQCRDLAESLPRKEGAASPELDALTMLDEIVRKAKR
jgi:hypothetical protein